MYDLIYGGIPYRDELLKIFPSYKIKDASDDIHPDRIEIEVDIDEKEYWKRIIMNGFIGMSLLLQSVILDKGKRKILIKEVQSWQEKKESTK